MSIEWVLVWVLVTGQGLNRQPSYSPPMKTKAECEKVQATAVPQGQGYTSTCIEVHILVPKAKP